MTVTAIILCHKLEQYIDRAVASVTTQVRKADKVLLLATDGREESRIACGASFRSGMDYRWTEDSFGYVKSHQMAATMVKTDSFFVLDADDWIMPGFIDRTAEWMEYHPKVGVVGCDYMAVTDTRADVLKLPDVKDLHIGNPLPSCSLIRTEAYKAVGGYPNECLNEDWALWVAMQQGGWELFRWPAVLFNHYRHATNVSHTISHRTSHAQILQKILSKPA